MTEHGVRDWGVETVRYLMLAAEFGGAGVFRAKADLFGSRALEQDANGRKYLFVLRLKNIAVQHFSPCTCSSLWKRFIVVSKSCCG